MQEKMPYKPNTLWVGDNNLQPPLVDQLEVSFFGPGYGECIVIHVGNYDWIIVDSCVDPVKKKPMALEYLRAINVNPAEAVKLIVATHWHDDHIRGLSTIYEKCPLAKFACSSAIKADHFLTLVDALGSRSMMTSSGVDEFFQIIEIMKTRKSSNLETPSVPLFAVSDRCLWESSGSKVYSLSPSDKTIQIALEEIATLIPNPKTPKRRIISSFPNNAAVVLWVETAGTKILLGSDLENTQNNKSWKVIANSNTRPSGKASIFKIPHHGSSNADEPQVWEKMLKKDPIAALTPFARGNVFLPTPEHCFRIAKNTLSAYSTAKPTTKAVKNKHRPSVVQRTIRESTRSIRELNNSIGQIQLRLNPNGSAENEWETKLFGDSIPLEKMYD